MEMKNKNKIRRRTDLEVFHNPRILILQNFCVLQYDCIYYNILERDYQENIQG